MRNGVIEVDMSSSLVLVIGGAGHQGRIVVRRLREQGLPVHVLTDEPTSGETQALRQLGVELVHGSLDDRASLDQALKGVDALFMVLDQTDAGPSGRQRHGKAIGDAAKQAGVRHVVYSAATGSDHHLLSCDRSSEIEDHLRELGLPLTVLRPVTIMEEIPWYWLSSLGREAVLATPYATTTRLPMICVDDVAGLAALAIAEPGQFRGQTIEIAGDKASMAEVADLLTQELNQTVRVTEIQVEGVFMLAETDEPSVDIPRLRSVYPQLHTVSTWLALGGGLELCRRALARQAV
jgi:uncharacterized protein YbjT (DUF2867 family)